VTADERVSGPCSTGSEQGAAPVEFVRPHVQPLVALLRGYQRWISPALPPTCRFYPTCSAYAVEALQVHGLLRGVALTAWRLLRCAPWHPGGIDPVPQGRRGRTAPPAGRTTDPRTRSAHTRRAQSRRAQSRRARSRRAEHHEEQAPC
jgi:uncharacterized protein